VLSPALEGVRLSLHVLAAAVWVGGQIVLAGLVPTLRTSGVDVPRAAARRFAQLAWPAFALLVLTGFWNLAAVHPSKMSTAWNVVLGVKLAVVVVSGASAALHQRATSRRAIALSGSVSGTSAVAALVMGVFLAG
jgi:putative copper export protein